MKHKKTKSCRQMPMYVSNMIIPCICSDSLQGNSAQQSLAIVNNCNYESIFWSFAYLDYDVDNQPDQAESLQKMISRLHPGAIYLLHGQSATNAAVLGDFIDQARELGYEFCLIEPDVQ